MHVEPHLVDYASLEKGAGEIASTHHADASAGLSFELPNEFSGVTTDKLHSRLLDLFEGARENVSPQSCGHPGFASGITGRACLADVGGAGSLVIAGDRATCLTASGLFDARLVALRAAHTGIPGLSPHEDRVYGGPVLCHHILYVTAEVEPVHTASGVGDKSVKAAGCTIGHGPHVSPPLERLVVVYEQNAMYTKPAFRNDTISSFRNSQVPHRAMSPRPRKVSDEQVFAAAHRAVSRVGPGELTLAVIAAEAGVTAGALVQRFGSKRALLLALSAGAADSAGGFIEQLRARHRSPLATLRDYAECMSHLAESPAALTRNLAYLQIDLADADFRKHLVVQSRATRDGFQKLLGEAIAAGELARGTDARKLAHAVEAVLSGSLLTWAIYREGSAASWIRYRVDAVLAPHLSKKKRVRQ